MAGYATAIQTESYATQDGIIVQSTFTYNADSEAGLNTVVPGLTTNQAVALTLTISEIRSMVMWSNEAVTIKTNSSGSPQDTFALVAGKPLMWDTDTWFPIPFLGNVTEMFITNSGAQSATVVLRFLLAV
jgi:hypothetical protein